MLHACKNGKVAGFFDENVFLIWREECVCLPWKYHYKRSSLSILILFLWINIYREPTPVSQVEIPPHISVKLNPFLFLFLADCHPFLQPAHKRPLLPQRGMCQQAAERTHQLWGKQNFKIPGGGFLLNRLHQIFSFSPHSWLLCQKCITTIFYYTWQRIWCYLFPLP